ncbi:MAG TPA: NAD-dependent epimerase/dehydratase family protein [Candidatus Limnocylindrales bacterium]|nr:NAD-dependent epimerase/dehydratase family protein [Candidatus Limnocylindrales bacterium]
MADPSGLAGQSVAVIGGAGFIGSHLVDRLVDEEPSRITVIDNLFLGRVENLSSAERRFPGLHVVERDATDADAVDAILREARADVVFNLAVVPLPASLERPRWSVEQNVQLALVPCELARHGRFRTLIHVSSSEAYGSAAYVPMDEAHPAVPSTPYAASKLAGDQLVLSYWHTFGIDAAIIRPFNNFGPRQNAGSYAGIIPIVVDRARRGEPIEIHGDGKQTRDFVFVRDTAEAALAVYRERRTRGRIVNVASGREVSVNELVAVLLELLEADVGVVHGPPRPGDVRRHLASIELARELIGYEPRTSLRDGLAETVAWYVGRSENAR